MFHNGFRYTNNGKKNGYTYYKCAGSAIYFCNGTAKKSFNNVVTELKPHSNIHILNNNNNEIMIKSFKNILKSRSKSENLPLRTIYDEEMLRHTTAASLYTWPTAESMMRLARRSSFPTLPQNLNELSIKFENNDLPRYTCCNSSIFKGCVTDNDGKSSIIFGCNNLIEHVLANGITEMHVDATFKVVPNNTGQQLLTLHCMIDNYSIPVAYSLMEAKTRNAYLCVFNFMKQNMFPSLQPEVIMTDFETALRDSLTNSFGGSQTRVVGCWFHYNQAIWKKMKALGFLHLVNANNHALKTLKMLMCLPLLQHNEIVLGFQLVKAYAVCHNTPMAELFNYYNRYWINQVGTNILSVHNLPRRTNNNLESFHNSMKYKFSVNHPNLWVFLGHITELNTKYHIVLNQLANALQPTRNLKSVYLMNSKCIKRATEQKSAGLLSIWQFLNKCSHSCSSYERRQRHWALGIEYRATPEDNEIDVPSPQTNNNFDIINPNIRSNGSFCITCTIIEAGDNVSQYIAIPCGHAWICESCVAVLDTQYPKTCPICRAEIEQFQRIYFS
ncbi:uncharacterized protein LOC126899841 [Daktulosphaira vitifoliae]|uniref:uncharacterized protein LOC126899841 n=1 Tax=Daktulosphaira vitifoliae TaxID=58002 RepID=UPI0021AAD5E0|nr:uncharacterized protein LOC126899841 [Daktulosphaira vitifoliae]